MVEFAGIDIAIVAGYLVVVVAIGLWAGRVERNAEDYFLAARALPWYLIGFSFFASNMSGASFVGLMGASYEHGLVVFHYEWTAALVLIIFALVMLPVFLRARLFTVPEYLEARFDRRSRWAYAGFTILTLVLIDTAGALYAGGIVVSTAFPNVSLWQVTFVLAILAGVYTLIGGLRAVVVTDALQSILMIVGASAILIFGLASVGGWEALFERVGPAQSDLFRPATDDFLPWPGILGVVLLGFYYWTVNQYFVQRALAARSLDHGRKGALFGGLLKLPNIFLMVIPGMIGLALYPNLDSPDRIFPTLAFELLPIGLRGLIVAALLAAIMSSLDSALNAAASLLTMDFVRPLKPGISGRKLLLVGRLFTGALIFVAALYAPMIESFGSLFQYFQSTLAYLVPPIVAVYLGGLLSPRFTAAGAFAAILVGLGVGVVLFLAQQVTGFWTDAGLPEIHFTYMAMIMFALSLGTITLVSVLTPPPPATVAAATFRRADLAPEAARVGQAWVADHRVQSVALFGLTIVLILAFL